MPASGSPWYKRLYAWVERRAQFEGPIKEAALHPVPRNTASWFPASGVSVKTSAST